MSSSRSTALRREACKWSGCVVLCACVNGLVRTVTILRHDMTATPPLHCILWPRDLAFCMKMRAAS